MQEHSHSMLELGRDSLMVRLDLPYRLTIHPLGFPAHIESNSREVISSLWESWGLFRPEFDAPPVRLSVIVSGSDTPGSLPAPVFRCRRHLLSITADAANFAACDLNAGYACAWITPQTVADRVYLRDSFTEAPLLSMLNTRHLAPVHAACVVHNGVPMAQRAAKGNEHAPYQSRDRQGADDQRVFNGAGVLLCGDSGSGKSSLALACALRGWTYLCDDASFLVRGLSGRAVVGNPFLMRFKPDAHKLFPQLGERTAAMRVNGKPTVHVQTSELPQIATVQRAEARYMVFLRRSARGEARLVHRREGCLDLLRLPLYGDQRDIAEQEATLHSLSDLAAFDFHYSDLDAAVDRLNLLLRTGG